MNIAIIGASGFVGTALTKEALQRGHQVTGIVRNPKKLAIKDSKLLVSGTDVADTNKLAKDLEGHDIVVSAYNAGWTNPNLYNDFIKGSEGIQEATKKSGVKRLLVIGGAGSLEVAPGVQLVDTPQFPAEYKAGATAARDYFNTLKKEAELDWTFFSPAILMNPGITDGRTGKYRLGTDQPVFDTKGESRLSVEDLAVAIIDEVENKQFIRKRFTAGY